MSSDSRGLGYVFTDTVPIPHMKYLPLSRHLHDSDDTYSSYPIPCREKLSFRVFGAGIMSVSWLNDCMSSDSCGLGYVFADTVPIPHMKWVPPSLKTSVDSDDTYSSKPILKLGTWMSHKSVQTIPRREKLSFRVFGAGIMSVSWHFAALVPRQVTAPNDQVWTDDA